MNDNPRSNSGILQKVRSLLAKAADPSATEAEAEAYNAKAFELASKYGVDQVLLADDEEGNTERCGNVVKDIWIPLDQPYGTSKGELLWAVTAPLGVKAVRATKWVRGKRKYAMHVFGLASDLERVELLFTSLLMQATNGVLRRKPPPGQDTRAFRISYWTGFASVVRRRLTEAESRARQDAESERRTAGDHGRSVELVLADRDSRIEAAFRHAYPNTNTIRIRRTSAAGWRSGLEDGARADIGTTRLGGDRRPEIG